MKSITQVEAAREVGTTKQQINRYVKSGRIPLNSEGKIDKKELDRFKAEYLDKSNGSNGDGKGKDKKRSLWEEQARLVGHKADIAEMESKKLAKKLVEVDRVVAEFGKLVTAVRQRLLGLGSKLASVGSSKPPEKLKKIIDDEIDRTLNEFGIYIAESGECGPTQTTPV